MNRLVDIQINPLKRRADFNQLDDVDTKKFRSLFDKQRIPTPTRFEHFSNELFIEIFDYLDAYDIYRGFSNLNIRFQNLLSRSLLPLKTDLTTKCFSTVEDRCRRVLIPNAHRLLSLHFHGGFIIQKFFDHCILDSSFSSLESIVLDEITDAKLLLILCYLHSLPRLFSLTISLEEDYYHNIGDLFRLVFRLPVLKYLKISSSNEEENNVDIPTPLNDKTSSIEHLIIDFPCDLDELTSILSHTPRLRHLVCRRLADTEEISKKELLLALPNLTHVSFTSCEVSFQTLEPLLKKIGASLQVLRMVTIADQAYLDGQGWKCLIKRHMPRLSKVYFKFCQIADMDDEDRSHEAISQFTSTFWTERGWIFEFKHSFGELIYSIHPHKQTWFNSSEFQSSGSQDVIHTSTLASLSNTNTSDIRLSIETPQEWDMADVDNMKLCFQAAHFTHLSVDCPGIVIGALIEMIRLLPNLVSLELFTLPSDQLACLSSEDAGMLLLVSITNRISKVKIYTVNDIIDVNFLMNLCSRMEHFEVGYKAEIHLESILGLISMANATRIPYLTSLSLYNPGLCEKTIEQVHRVIDFEHLFHTGSVFQDYAVRCIANRILLQWKR